MFKKNQVVVIAPKERCYDKPRLAVVKSVRKDGTVNCVFAMYKNSNIFTDYLCDSADILAVTDLTVFEFGPLATCYANKDPQDPSIVRQQAIDARYPEYAAMRKAYGARESIEEGIRRVRAARLAA